MPRNQKDTTFDFPMLMHDTVGVAAAGAALVGGVARILDLGAGRVDGRVLVDVSAVTVGAGDLSTLILEVSNSATFAATIFCAGALFFGQAATTLESVNTAVPRHQELAFTNEINGTVYRYARLWIVYAAAGALTFTAHMVKEA